MEISLTQAQIEDSAATLAAAVDAEFSPSDIDGGLYQPDQSHVPRPDFAVFAAHLAAHAEHNSTPLPASANQLTVRPRDAEVFVAQFAGLRGIAQVAVMGPQGRQIISGPAIILAGGSELALLTAEPNNGDNISDTQHALLESEYAKHLANVSSQHSTRDVANAGEIAPALVVASSLVSNRAHGDMHRLAASNGRTFGANFSAGGRQDIQIGSQTRFVRSAIIPTTRAIMHIAEHHQLPSDARLLGVSLSAGELAVGMTLAATTSRERKAPDLRANLSNMIRL